MTQSFQLFAAATKDKRIATFQANNAFSTPGFAQQNLVNLFLRYAVVARAFSHEDPIGIAAHQIHDVVGDQAVINHYIGLLYLLKAFEGQQSGVADLRLPALLRRDDPAARSAAAP